MPTSAARASLAALNTAQEKSPALHFPKMNANENECLRYDDIRLFHKGACHVFADALKTQFPEEGYTLKRVLVCDGFDSQQAYHVFASKGEFIVDASGIKREEDYVAWVTACKQTVHFGDPCVPKIRLHEVNDAELFEHHHNDEYNGTVNRWGLFSGVDFVVIARQRANALIEHWPKKYRVSVLEEGSKLKKSKGV